MLTKEALTSAMPLTQVLDGKRMFLMPIEGTPLAALAAATRADAKLYQTRGENREPYIDVDTLQYLANTKDKTLGFAQHDMVMEEIVSTAQKAVQGHMQYARTVVAPAVTALVEKTSEALRAMTPSSLLGMSVVQWNPPAPMLMPAMASIVKKFDHIAYDSPALVMRMAPLGASEIIALMHTGAGSLDSAIDEWAAVKGDSFFLGVWQNIFQVVAAAAGSRPGVASFREYVEKGEEALDTALAVFLLARKLVDAGPLPNTEMTAHAFESVAAEYRNQAGARLARVLEVMKTAEQKKHLVRGMRGRNTIEVNASVYRAWVEAGGENEVLFGALVKNETLVTTDQVNARADELKQAWANYAALTATVESNRKFERVKQTLATVFADQLRAITDEDEATEANRQMVMKLFNEQLATVNIADTEDLWGLCLRLVCRSRFFRTEAERILSGIERIKRANPTLSVREAAAVSMMEYIGWWVSKQFRVYKV